MSGGAGVVTVPVEMGERRYEVAVGDGALRRLASMVAAGVPRARRAAVVTHEALTSLPWFAGVDPGVPFDVHTVPEGEAAKSLGTVEALCRAFARSGLARSDVVVAVGGGVVTDVAGFAAATYHRGTAYVNVATSLLAQVDAAVGGKTGVNLPEGKNLVGAFWQPAAVVCDVATLATLPGRELACGRGEMAKYAFLVPFAGAPGTGAPQRTGMGPAGQAGPGAPAPGPLSAGDPGGGVSRFLDLGLGEQVAHCVGVKAAVVAADEREGGLRMVLNYGHTLAHALEAAAFDGGDLRHGEAVAVGLVFAAQLARRLGRVDDERVDVHRAVVAAFGLSSDLPAGADPRQLLELMARDKKARHDLTFVLDGPNGVEPVGGVDPADVVATLTEMAGKGD